jgi:RimJ/RimL family protein N-acetyltransferase
MVSPCSLRPIEDELPELLRLMWDPDATGEYQLFGFRVNKSRELQRRWQDDGLIADHGSSFLAVSLPDGTAAGWVTWHEAGPPGVAEIGIVLFPDHRGRGLGTEAQRQLVDYLFNTTAVHRIQAGTEVANTAEQRALEKAGFRREGVQRGLYIRAGAWRDSAMYGVTRTDWTPHRDTGRPSPQCTP